MSTQTLSDPAAVQERLEEIDELLATLQNEYEETALDWFRAKRDREHEWARVYLDTDGPAHVRKAAADGSLSEDSIEKEGKYEARKAKVRMLETRANIGMSILRSQSRLGA